MASDEEKTFLWCSEWEMIPAVGLHLNTWFAAVCGVVYGALGGGTSLEEVSCPCACVSGRARAQEQANLLHLLPGLPCQKRL